MFETFWAFVCCVKTTRHRKRESCRSLKLNFFLLTKKKNFFLSNCFFVSVIKVKPSMFNGGNGDRPPWKEEAAAGGGGPPVRPTITLPPRTDTLFNGGLSPGPMTLLSSFFSDGGDDCKSFSQLLAGAMMSPAAPPAGVLDSPGFFSPQVKILTHFYLYKCF